MFEIALRAFGRMVVLSAERPRCSRFRLTRWGRPIGWGFAPVFEEIGATRFGPLAWRRRAKPTARKVVVRRVVEAVRS